MAGRTSKARRAWVPILATVSLASVAVLVPQGASGRAGSACDDPNNAATFTYDEGVALRVSAGYNPNLFGMHKLASSYKGDTTFGAGSCTDTDPFAAATILLGDRDDRGRLDGKKPNFDSQAPDPIPSFVSITMDGGAGSDDLTGHKGPDKMLGRGGDDVIDIAGGGADTANCGPGHDAVDANGADVTKRCEVEL